MRSENLNFPLTKLVHTTKIDNSLAYHLWLLLTFWPIFRYDSSIQPISVPITVANVGNTADTKDKKNATWNPYILTCESKFSAILPFGVSLSLRGNLIQFEWRFARTTTFFNDVALWNTELLGY